MKIVELINDIQIPITNEEAEVLEMFDDNKEILKSSLEARQAVLANQLVNKDILYRKNETGQIIYRKKI
jgi:hypothetical protein